MVKSIQKKKLVIGDITSFFVLELEKDKKGISDRE